MSGVVSGVLSGVVSEMYVAVRQTWNLASRSCARAHDGACAQGTDPPVDDRSALELQEARLAAGVCLLELSEQTGLGVAKLASWERGEDQPDGCVRAALLDVLRERGRAGGGREAGGRRAGGP